MEKRNIYLGKDKKQDLSSFLLSPYIRDLVWTDENLFYNFSTYLENVL